MYYEEKKKNKEKLILYCLMVVIITLLLVLILRTEVTDRQVISDYNAEKLNYEENTVDTEKTAQSAEHPNIENAINAIVGISKLKQSGSSIFVNKAEEKLGLGSGVLITDNGYILTNQHVAGNKYSNK